MVDDDDLAANDETHAHVHRQTSAMDSWSVLAAASTTVLEELLELELELLELELDNDNDAEVMVPVVVLAAAYSAMILVAFNVTNLKIS